MAALLAMILHSLMVQTIAAKVFVARTTWASEKQEHVITTITTTTTTTYNSSTYSDLYVGGAPIFPYATLILSKRVFWQKIEDSTSLYSNLDRSLLQQQFSNQPSKLSSI